MGWNWRVYSAHPVSWVNWNCTCSWMQVITNATHIHCKEKDLYALFQLTSAFWQVINLFSHKETASIVLCIQSVQSPWGGTLTRTYCSWIQREHTYSLIVWGKEYRISDFYKSYKVNRLYKAMSLEIHSHPSYCHSVEDSRAVLCCDMAMKIIQ